ncbi:MAG: hypothetical protein ACUVQR_04555 [Thermogutta sp.]
MPQWITIGLLGVIACSLVVIVVFLISGQGRQAGFEGRSAGDVRRTSSAPSPPAAKDGETVKREEVPKPPAPPPTIGKPDRIRDVLLEGRKYEVTAAFVLTGPVRDKAWGFERIVHMNYIAEVQFTRRIDHNDGKWIEEFRHIKQSRMVKAESTAEFRVAWFEPGVLLLAGLDLVATGGALTVPIAHFTRMLVDPAFKQAVNEENTKIAAMIDSLEGKQFRVVYEDGKGVVELTPAGCDLTEEERDFLLALSVVSDAYILPNTESKVGDTWSVPAEALSDFVPPAWRGQPRGQVTIRRVRDFKEGDHQFARLEIDSGSFEVVSTDSSWERIVTLTPRGWLEYDITEGHVARGELRANASMHRASRDHLLFETRFEVTPQTRCTYSCRLLPE